MPYVIKINKVRGYVSNFYKNKKGELKISFHKHLKQAKIWKTEQGAKKGYYKILYGKNYNPSDLKIIKKSNSRLGLVTEDDKEKLTITGDTSINEKNNQENKLKFKERFNIIFNKLISKIREIYLKIKDKIYYDF